MNKSNLRGGGGEQEQHMGGGGGGGVNHRVPSPVYEELEVLHGPAIN